MFSEKKTNVSFQTIIRAVFNQLCLKFRNSPVIKKQISNTTKTKFDSEKHEATAIFGNSIRTTTIINGAISGLLDAAARR